MSINSLTQEALQEALQRISTTLKTLRRDTLKRLVLGGVIGSTAAQETKMDYETVLKNLDKLADTSLIKIVKEIVKDHPTQLIVDDTHNHKQYARAILAPRNCTQIYYCREHKRFEPAIHS